MLIDLYYELNETERKTIFLLSDKNVTPLDCWQSKRYLQGEMSDVESGYRLKDAYAIHYFFGDWR